MRLTRRGVIAQRKGGGYVWAVYSLAPGVDESVFTTGSFNMTASFGSTPSLMAADGYTVSASGTISLTSAVKTNVSALTAGKYIVSISSSSSTTTTSTQYVYKVTGVTSSGGSWSKTYTVSYERYEVSLTAKGEDTGLRVKSETDAEYPINGEQGGYYYVLIATPNNPVVWLVYDTNYVVEWGRIAKSATYADSATLYYSNAYTIDQASGIIQRTGILSVKATQIPNDVYLYAVKSSGGAGGYIYADQNTASSDVIGKVYRSENYITDTSKHEIFYTIGLPKRTAKGAYTGTYVFGSPGDYPDAGVRGNYYYERTTPY